MPDPVVLLDLVVVRPGGVDNVDLSDLTTGSGAVQVGPAFWLPDDVLVIPMDPEPSEAEQTAIRRRLVTEDAADEAWLYSLLDLTPTSPFEERWLAAELAKYGEAT